MSIQFLSDRYTIRDLLPQDAKMVCEVLKANTIFYKYHPPMVCLSIRNCIKRAPKSTVPGQHRFGFEKPCFCSL